MCGEITLVTLVLSKQFADLQCLLHQIPSLPGRNPAACVEHQHITARLEVKIVSAAVDKPGSHRGIEQTADSVFTLPLQHVGGGELRVVVEVNIQSAKQSAQEIEEPRFRSQKTLRRVQLHALQYAHGLRISTV